MTCICSFDRNTSFTANEQRERIALSIHLENISLPKNNLHGIIIIQRVSFSFFDEFRRERERFHLANLLVPIIRHLLHFQNTCLPRVFIRVNQHRTLPRCLSLHSFEKRRKIKDIIIRVIGSLQTYEYSPFCLVLCNRDFTPSFYVLSLSLWRTEFIFFLLLLNRCTSCIMRRKREFVTLIVKVVALLLCHALDRIRASNKHLLLLVSLVNMKNNSSSSLYISSDRNFEVVFVCWKERINGGVLIDKFSIGFLQPKF